MTPAEIAAGVAADIRKYGHTNADIADGISRPSCCLIMAPTLEGLESAEKDAYEHAVHVAADVPWSVALWRWNDTHTTSEVLAVLDQIATGGTA